MLIYLYGPDSYRRREKLRELQGKYREKYVQSDFLRVDLEESPRDWILVRDFLGQGSLFVASKLCVVFGSGAVTEKTCGKQVAGEWAALLKKTAKAEKVFLIISDEKKPLKAFQFLLRAPVRHQEFTELTGKKLERFVLAEAKNRGVRFDAQAERAFLSFLARSSARSWEVTSTLEQVSLAKFYGAVSLRHLQQIVSLEGHDESFRLALGLVGARGAGRLLKLEELALRGDDPSYTFNLLGSLVRGEDALALAEADEGVKGGTSEVEVALTRFVLDESLENKKQK